MFSVSEPLVDRIFFGVHGSKFKPDPFVNLGQASEISVSHTKFFFGICKYTFNCFFPMLVQHSVMSGMSEILSEFNILRPNMLCDKLFVFGTVGAMT